MQFIFHYFSFKDKLIVSCQQSIMKGWYFDSNPKAVFQFNKIEWVMNHPVGCTGMCSPAVCIFPDSAERWQSDML